MPLSSVVDARPTLHIAGQADHSRIAYDGYNAERVAWPAIVKCYESSEPTGCANLQQRRLL